jgi:phosphatidylglycerophosphatase A
LALIPAAALLFALGVWASGRYADANDISDPSPVVVDEVVGQWLALALVPLDPILYAVGFFFFRLFDVWKPFPANWADRNLKGGVGIMTDDLFAGLYAAIVTWGVHRWLI